MKSIIKKIVLSTGLIASTLTYANTVELKLFHRWPNEPVKSFIEGRIEKFESENPNIKVTIDQVLNDSYKDKLRVILGSSNSPDVFFSWSGEFGDNIVRNGKALDLTNLIKADGTWLKKSVILSQVKPFTYNNRIYGLPWQMNGKALFYNVDLFKSHHLEVPKTFKDLIRTCGVLKKSGIIPIIFSSKQHWALSHWVGTFNERIIPQKILKEDYNRATGEFTNPLYVQSLNQLKFMVDSCSNKFSNGMDHSTERSMFIAGRAAMDYLEYGEIKYLEDDAKFNWKSINFPKFTSGKGEQNTMEGAPEGFMISSSTKHPEAAYKLVKFLIAGDTAKKLTSATGFISSAVGAVNKNTASPSQIEAAKQIAGVDSMYLWLDNALDIRIVNTYMNGVQLMLENKMTAEEVMQRVQKTAEEVRNSIGS